MNISDFSLERISPDKLKDLVYLFKTVHSRKIPVTYFKNKFETSFTKKSYIGYIAYHKNGEPAAFYGIFPCLLTNGSKIVLASQSGDTITNPKYQKRGLFIHLAQQTYILANKKGIEIIFGFPNKNSSYGFFNKLNWIKLNNFQSFAINYKSSNIYNILNRISLTKVFYRLYFRIIYPFILTEPFANSNFQENEFSILRDLPYFNYKTYEKSFFVKIKGFKFWFKFGDGLLIGDVEKFENSMNHDFFKALKKLNRILGTRKTTFHCMQNTFLNDILKEEFDHEDSIEIGVLLLNDNLKNCIFKFSYGDIDTF